MAAVADTVEVAFTLDEEARAKFLADLAAIKSELVAVERAQQRVLANAKQIEELTHGNHD